MVSPSPTSPSCLLNQYLLSLYYGPGTVLGSGVAAVGKTPCLLEFA